MKIRERSSPASSGRDHDVTKDCTRSFAAGWLLLCVVVAAVSLCLPPGADAGDSETSPLPALYKDGQKIFELGEVTEVPLGNRERVLPAPSTAARAFYRDVVPDRPPDLFRKHEEYVSAVQRCGELAGMLLSGRAMLPEEEAALEGLLALEDRVAASSRALLDRFDAIGRTLADRGLPPEKLQRHREITDRHRLEAERILRLLARIRAARDAGGPFGAGQAIQELDRYLADRIFVREPPLAEPAPLPRGMRAEEADVTSAGALAPGEAPAYPNVLRERRGYDPADLEETIDVQFTEDVIALADSLDHSPAQIFQFVRDNFQFEAYLGSRKGSQQTLDHRSGNDYDQASLLIALLRVSGVPARYATGEIKMPIDRATNWLGVWNKHNAGSLLATAGMDAVLYIAGPDTVALGCQRVWVEGWVPLINYRGAVGDSIGATWVPMDPIFKQYSYDEGVNYPAEIGFDGEAFVDDYISTFHTETPIEMFRQMLLDGSGLPYDDLITTRGLVPESDGILPGTLPYEIVQYDGSFSEIPSNMRFRIRFHVYGEGTDLDYTTTIPQIAQKQLTITYVGATPEDQQIIDDAGGIFNVETPYLVDLKPVLMIDGCEVARGTGDVMMGLTHYFDMHFTTPEGDFNEVPLVSNYILAGNYLGIGIDTEDAFPARFDIPQTTCEEGNLGQEVHQTAITYLNNVDIAADHLADMMHQVVMNDVAEAIVEQTVTVLFSGDLPISFDWNGMIVDADRRIIGPFSVDGVDYSCDYMRMAGADGSIQENRIWETRFEVEAISTIKILELAADSLINICEITSSIPSDCPGIDQPAYVINAINNALAQGHHVIIPETQLTYYNWTGTGWIDLDPVTCAAGYIISGGQDGGATVEEWDIDYPDLFCIKPIGPVTVTPAAPGDLYCAESSDVWTFHVPTIEYWGKDAEGECQLLDSEPKDFPMEDSIADVAALHGAGIYVFRCGSSTSECGCTTTEKTVTIVKPDILSVVFTSDDGVLTDHNSDFATSGGAVFNPRGWRGGTNNPVSHTKALQVSADVEVKIVPSGVAFDLEGACASSYLRFQPTSHTSTGSNQVIHLTSQGQLPNAVAASEDVVEWKISINGDACGSVSVRHKVYVTWGSPGAGPTLKRIDWVCRRASAAATPQAVASQLWDAVASETSFGGREDGWALLDGGAGDCDNQARCMKYAYEMLGTGPATVRFVRASTNAGAGNCLDLESRVVGPDTQYLIMDFDPGAGYGWNAFEGCCEAGGNYHAITPKHKESDDYEMLRAIGCQQYWVLTNVPPGSYGWGVIGAIEEVAIP